MLNNISVASLKRRKLKNKIFILLFLFFSSIPFLLLFAILWGVISKGILQFNFEFFSKILPAVGEQGGGILNALLGTLQLGFFTCLISIPISLLSAVYIVETKGKKISSFISMSNSILLSYPSIIIGIVVYSLIVQWSGYSMFSGVIAMSALMIPLVTVSCVEVILLIPNYIREGAYALGVPHHRVILKVILPLALPGTLSAILISLGRVSGETALLLFTASGNSHLNLFNFGESTSSLSLVIYQFGISPYERWLELAWGASALLVLMIFILNISTKIVSRKWQVKF